MAEPRKHSRVFVGGEPEWADRDHAANRLTHALEAVSLVLSPSWHTACSATVLHPGASALDLMLHERVAMVHNMHDEVVPPGASLKALTLDLVVVLPVQQKNPEVPVWRLGDSAAASGIPAIAVWDGSLFPTDDRAGAMLFAASKLTGAAFGAQGQVAIAELLLPF